MAQPARREGPFVERLKVFFMRSVLFNAWRVAERLGIRLGTEGPAYAPTDARSEELDALIARARSAEGVIDASSTGFPAHELLTHLVERHGLLLHGSNHTGLDALEPPRVTSARRSRWSPPRTTESGPSSTRWWRASG